MLLAIVLKWGLAGCAVVVWGLFQWRPRSRRIWIWLGTTFIIIAVLFVMRGAHFISKNELGSLSVLAIIMSMVQYFYTEFAQRRIYRDLEDAISKGNTSAAVTLFLEVLRWPTKAWNESEVRFRDAVLGMQSEELEQLSKLPNKSERLDAAIATLRSDVQQCREMIKVEGSDLRPLRKQFYKHARELSRAAGFLQLG